MKLKYLTVAMSALRSLGKSSYITWLRFFNEGNGSRSRLMVQAFSHTGFVVCVTEWTGRGLKP